MSLILPSEKFPGRFIVVAGANWTSDGQIVHRPYVGGRRSHEVRPGSVSDVESFYRFTEDETFATRDEAEAALASALSSDTKVTP